MKIGTWFITVATLLTSSSAMAYVLEQAETGANVHWPHTCVSWWMESAGCPDVTPDETREVLRASFATWDAVNDMYLDFEEAGITCFDTVGLDAVGPMNVALWRHGDEAWPYTARVVGLTTLTFDTETGEIVDADMEFNGEDFTFSTDARPGAYDLQQAVTHEVGHVLGLGHSLDPESVMYATAGPGAVEKRQLADDDIAGVADNHGLADAPSSEPCGIAPTQGTLEAPHCPEVRSAPSGCSSGRGGMPQALLLVLCAMVSLLGRRRRWAAVTLSTVVVVTAVLPACLARAQPCNPYMVPDGSPVYWPVDELELSIDPDLPEEIANALWLDATHEAVAAWTELTCVDMTVTVRDDVDGFTDCPGNVSNDDIQCIFWALPEDDWPYGTALIAVTLVHHNTVTAEIVDADIAFNGTGAYTWSSPEICDPDTPDHDLLATLTHEFGHFFGLDHSTGLDSVMEGSTRPGDCGKRTVDGIATDCLCDTLARVSSSLRPGHDTLDGDTGDGGAETGPTADATPSSSTDACGGAEQPSCNKKKSKSGCQSGGTWSSPLPLLSLLGLAHLAMRRRRRGPRVAPAR